jgi:uncharacterized ParB-like nuclease family protein
MIKLFPAFALLAALASAGTFTGVITESMCGMDHSAMNMGADPDCIRQCVKSHGGAKYVLHDGKNQYKLSDQQTPERYAAQRVRVTGTLFERTGIIKVEKIEPVR